MVDIRWCGVHHLWHATDIWDVRKVGRKDESVLRNDTQASIGLWRI